MTLEDNLKNLIDTRGFIGIDRMMREALTANVNSYYRKPNILGENGDFVTSPEISQLFGEMIGLWAIEQWQKLDYPSIINLVELGPGRGLLMRDLLRVAKLVPAFYQAINIQLLEINPHLIDEQKIILATSGKSINWLKDIKELAPLPTIIIANEFFDALPIKQYIKQDNYWHEVVLTTDYDHDLQHFTFAEILTNPDMHRELNVKYTNAAAGDIIEASSESLQFINNIAEHFKIHSGSALIIDYGYDLDPKQRNKNQYKSTLQAVKDHKFHSIMASLGEADLSAHVDFYALSQQATKCNIDVEPVINQNHFLNKYGIGLRLILLCQNFDQQRRDILRKQVDRLMARETMGELFKVLVINKF